MNVEVFLIIGGGAVLLFLIIAPLGVWIGRRSSQRVSAGPAASRGGLVLMAVFISALVLGAVLAQNFSRTAKTLFGAGYFLLVTTSFMGIGHLLEKRGFSVYRKRAESSDGPNS